MAIRKIVWYSFLSLQTFGILYTGRSQGYSFLRNLMLFVSSLKTIRQGGGHIFLKKKYSGSSIFLIIL